MLFLDTETRSGADLKKRGLFPYIEDPYFKVILVSWAINESEVKVWDCLKDPMPPRLKQALEDPTEQVVMHNSKFDRRVLAKAGIADIPVTRIIDTMVQAYAHGLPGSLDMLSTLFKLGDQSKDKNGTRLIKIFCNPKKVKLPSTAVRVIRDDNGYLSAYDSSGKPVEFKILKAAKPSENDYETFINPHADKEFEQDWEDFKTYAQFDIVAMRELFRRMPQANYPNGFDRKLWELDQLMADRGILVDLEMAEAAVKLFEETKAESRDRIQELTNGEVGSTTEGAKLISFMNENYGTDFTSLSKDIVSTALENNELPEEVLTLLKERAEASKTTPAKYTALLLNCDKDGRLHDTIQFCGASRTGRDAGRVFQPQNLMRPTRWGKLSGDELSKAIEDDIKLLKIGAISMLDPDPIDLLSNLIRSVIKASEGKKICVADLSNIEGRVLVWLAGEVWKVEYFREFDRGTIKFDNYVMAYAKALNCTPEEVDSARRAIGKVMELGLGYGGGVAAFLKFVEVYRLDLQKLAEAVALTADDPELYKECHDSKYDWAVENGYSAGLDRFVFAACEYLKTKWRQSHPYVAAFWKNLDLTFKAAVNNPGQTFPVENTNGKLKMLKKGSWLFIRLPSGRLLTYLHPKVSADGELSFLGVNQTTRRVERIKTYGGKLAENVTSATAREVIFHALPEMERRNYNVIFRVHDEAVTECPDTPEYNHAELERIMSTPHSWCEDLPLAASGFTAYRYRGKD